jgi:hypothetical protein
MTGEIKAVKLHVMETTECALSCAGCYLKGPLDKGYSLEEIIERFKINPTSISEINSAFYLNNLNRDPQRSVRKYQEVCAKFSQTITNSGSDDYLLTWGSLLVTDSISAAQLDQGSALILAEFDELWASCRNLSSVKHLLNSQMHKWSFLFTVGTDADAILAFLYDIPESEVELNLRKPYSFSEYLRYQNYITIGSQLKGDIRTDNCMRYKQQGRDCSKPTDFIELTRFLDADEYYLCAYPSHSCNCTMSRSI